VQTTGTAGGYDFVKRRKYWLFAGIDLQAEKSALYYIS